MTIIITIMYYIFEYTFNITQSDVVFYGAISENSRDLFFLCSKVKLVHKSIMINVVRPYALRYPYVLTLHYVTFSNQIWY